MSPPVDAVTRRRLTATWVSCLVAFAALALLVESGAEPLSRFDQLWSARATAFTAAHGWCEVVASTATRCADFWTITVLTVAAALVSAGRREARLAVWVAVTVAGSSVLNWLVKSGLERARPTVHGAATAPGFAFPSGHTQAATTTYVAVVLVVGWQLFHPGGRWRKVSAVLVSALIAAVGCSRVLLGAHWPTDVLGGWLLGSAWVTAAALVLLRERAQPSPVPRLEPGAAP